MTRPESVRVFKGRTHAGDLVSESKSTTFRYRRDYDGPPIATTLPFGEDVVSPGRAVPTYFANLLPEGRRLTALRRASKAAADDDLSLLVSIGADTVGDVVVSESGQYPLVAEPTIPRVDDIVPVDFSTMLAAAGFSDHVGIPGVQDKISGGMITMKARVAGEASIIKLSPPDYPFAVENEAYFLGLAGGLGLPIPAHRILRDEKGATALQVARFDRGPGGARYAVEDGCQVLDRYPADKYSVSLEELAAALTERCASSLVAARAVVLQVLFAWLTGNGDLHAKNLSILQRDSEWRMSPIYDIPSTSFYDDTSMALSMDGRQDNLRRRHFVDFGRTLGLPPKVLEKLITKALDATGSLDRDLEAGLLPFNANLTRTVRRRLARRRRDLEP